MHSIYCEQFSNLKENIGEGQRLEDYKMAEVVQPDIVQEQSDSTDESNRRDDGLPSSFDVLIVGTGLVESIVSAAVSRGGHTVLHIDPGEYYGGTWATFGFDQWMNGGLTEAPSEVSQGVNVSVKDYEGSVKWQNPVRSFQQEWYCQDETIKENLIKQQRRFNIDVMPKLIAAREEIVQLLIKSNVSRYLEFLRVSRLLTNLPPPMDTVIEPIPLSRSDIFTSKSLSLVEKRGLVKLIEAVMKPQTVEEDENVTSDGDGKKIPQTFEDLVKANKVSEKIKHLIKSSVTVLEDGFSPEGETFNHQFSSRCQLFLNSIGRYGNQTPFLWTLYGISEICQAFCRLSAVYGGVFILKRYLSQITSSEDGYEITTEQTNIKVKHVVIGPNMELDISGREQSKKGRSCVNVGRAVLITSGGNIRAPDENSKVKGDGIFLYRLGGMEVIEMNQTSQAVPKDYRLLQISFPVLESEADESHCKKMVEGKLSSFLNFTWSSENKESPGADANVTANEDAKPTTEVQSKPQVIYGSYFILNLPSGSCLQEVLNTAGVDDSPRFIIGSSVSSTDLDNYVERARDIYAKLYPDEEFLPKAPDAEELEEANGEPEEEDFDNQNQAQPGMNDGTGTETISPATEEGSPQPSQTA